MYWPLQHSTKSGLLKSRSGVQSYVVKIVLMASITLHLIEADQLDQLGSETRQFREKNTKMLPKNELNDK